MTSMILRATVFTTIAFYGGCCVEAKAQMSESISPRVFKIDLNAISQSQSKDWVIGHFNPDKNNNVLEIKSAFINGDTGEIVERPEGKDVTNFSGRFTLVQKLFDLEPLTISEKPVSVNYGWKTPLRLTISSQRSRPDEEIVFYTGGFALLRWQTEKQGRDMFQEVHSLPDGWADFVKPTLKMVSGKVFENAATADSLIPLLKSSNPLAALTAARTLKQKLWLQGETLNSAFRASFQSPTPIGTQALVFWTTTTSSNLYSREDNRLRNADAKETTSKIVQNATGKDLLAMLKGLRAGGVFVAYDVFDLTPSPEFGPTLLREIATKVKLLPGATGSDKEAKALLANFQIEPPKQAN